MHLGSQSRAARGHHLNFPQVRRKSRLGRRQNRRKEASLATWQTTVSSSICSWQLRGFVFPTSPPLINRLCRLLVATRAVACQRPPTGADGGVSSFSIQSIPPAARVLYGRRVVMTASHADAAVRGCRQRAVGEHPVRMRKTGNGNTRTWGRKVEVQTLAERGEKKRDQLRSAERTAAKNTKPNPTVP